MNFNFFIFLILISACGVKGDPVPPKSPHTPSLMENYPDIETEQKLDDVKQKPQQKR